MSRDGCSWPVLVCPSSALPVAASSREALSAWRLSEWLGRQRETNEREQGPIGLERPQVLITTVHQAKGLEFETVLIPQTKTSFWPRDNSVLTNGLDEGSSAGWTVGRYHDRKAESATWNSLKWGELEENIRDEARLLYVAMTRAIRRLYVSVAPGDGDLAQPKSWADLLREFSS